jgi:chromosomal replication initiator protein
VNPYVFPAVDFRTRAAFVKRVKPFKNRTPLEPQVIIAIVADYYKVTPADLMKKTRERNICFVRQVAQYFLKKKTKLSLEKIGEQFVRKGKPFDHTSVIHSVQKVKDLRDAYPEIDSDLNSILELITARE